MVIGLRALNRVRYQLNSDSPPGTECLGNWITYWNSYWLTILHLHIKEHIMTDRYAYLIFAVVFVVVIAVADANWPTHMGPQNALADALLSLLP